MTWGDLTNISLSRPDVRRLCGALEEKYGRDPNGFIRDHMDFSGLRTSGLTDQQKLIGHELQSHHRVCVSSGGGTGKTAYCAMLAIWGALCHVDSRQLLTGPSGNNVSDNLYAEMRMWRGRCRFGGLLEPRARLTHVKHHPEWYVVTKAPPKDAADQEISGIMAGLHARWIQCILDEAANVHDAVFAAINGTCTQDESYVAAISNPVSGSGFYYDVITAAPDEQGLKLGYRFIRLNSEESPLVDDAFVNGIITAYGKDSNMYRAKVLGYPTQVTEDVVISPSDYDRYVSENREAQDGAVVLGVDPNAGGEDKCVYCHRRGDSIVDWTNGPKTNDPSLIADDIVRLYLRRYRNDYFVTVIDAIGAGAVIYRDLVRRRLFPVVGHMGSEAAEDVMMFANRRTEVYWNLGQMFPYLQWPVKPPERLKKALVNMVFGEDNKGRKALIEKKKLKKRLGFSPDDADALTLAVSVNPLSVGRNKVLTDGVIAQLTAGVSVGMPADLPWGSPGSGLAVGGMLSSAGQYEGTVLPGVYLNDTFAEFV